MSWGRVMGINAKVRFDGDSILDKMRKAALAKAEEKVRFLRCAEHGNSVKVALDGNSIRLSGWCCEKFRDQAVKVVPA